MMWVLGLLSLQFYLLLLPLINSVADSRLMTGLMVSLVVVVLAQEMMAWMLWTMMQ